MQQHNIYKNWETEIVPRREQKMRYQFPMLDRTFCHVKDRCCLLNLVLSLSSTRVPFNLFAPTSSFLHIFWLKMWMSSGLTVRYRILGQSKKRISISGETCLLVLIHSYFSITFLPSHVSFIHFSFTFSLLVFSLFFFG